MTAQITHRIEVGWPGRPRPLRSLSSLPRAVWATLAATLGVLLGVATATAGRARGSRSVALHAAGFLAFDAGVWDLAGRGWALIAALPLLVLLDLVAGDDTAGG